MSIESVMPSNHLILCHPLLLLLSIFPSIRIFSNESALSIRWPKYWSFSFYFFSYFIFIHVLMPFSQIIPPPSPTESKRLFCTSVSLLLSRIQGCHYHLSKFSVYFKTFLYRYLVISSMVFKYMYMYICVYN